MADWYSASSPAAQARILAAWGDAPIDKEEVLGFILDTAREQVEAYAPAGPMLAPPTFGPVTLTWPNGWTFDLSREGDIVTGVLTTTAAAGSAEVKPIPAEFAAAGNVRNTSYNSDTSPTLVVTLNDTVATGSLGVIIGGSAPAGTKLAIKWLADPVEPVPATPDRYVYAQLQQAKNLYTAGTVRTDGGFGDGEFSYQPRPLDKTIRTIIRPIDGIPHVL